MASAIFAPGRVALVSGGASGVGLACARACVKAGMHVVIADKDASNLQSAAKQLTASLSGGNDGTEKGSVLTLSCDVTNRQHWHVVRDTLQAEYCAKGIPFTVFFNNAGISGASEPQARYSLGDLSSGAAAAFDASKSGASELEEAESANLANWRSVIDVNFWSQKLGLEILSPLLLRSVAHAGEAAKGAIVCTGSKQGITCPPGNACYNVSKAAVKMTAEHAAWELRQVANEQGHPWQAAAGNTSVHLLVPGWTFTGLTGAKSIEDVEKPDGAWFPDQVADYMLEKVGKGDFYIICPDGSVTEKLDNARMQWTMGDITERRPALSRWHDGHKDTFEAFVKERA